MMRAIKLQKLALLFLAATVLALAGCARGPEQEGAAARREPTANPAATPGGKILYWKSTMVPGYRSDKPGKDPMGMELVPVYAGEAEAGPPGTVAINPRTVQNIGVKTTVVRREMLTRDLRTIGRIDYDERLVTDVAPKIGGWVENQYVNFPGQMVRRGEPLGTIYSPELVATEQEYLNALQFQKELKASPLDDAVTGARNLARSVETRLRYWDITDAQIKALRERGKITRTMVLHAPFTGIVVKKNVFQGGYVKPGESMFQLADLSKIWVYADIYEYEMPWIRLGQEAAITLAYEPGVTYHGRVIFIYPYLKEKTRTVEVRMEFRNGPRFELKPGMWADVNLRPVVSRKALVVPVDAVIRTGKRNFAILALGGGHFAPREIKLGAQAGNQYEVLAGVKEGDSVVDSAEFLIDSESSLQSAFGKMTWQPPAAESAPSPASKPPPIQHPLSSGGAGGAGPAMAGMGGEQP
jgi:RND family efflux transporter MFP subunit